ncbi:hypothetical protein NA57DRAFT_58251 [Rhizodiscina lignyota]|uniref:Uncharacterized protein n=1 Tax=Rhizodiscina lignyota TaxID=1504668 RepID=A0A9P4IBQ0_9PEZI|nr:hypothetical protein NA57DRAFT_58251 [Rhizodiscina lignyota]
MANLTEVVAPSLLSTAAHAQQQSPFFRLSKDVRHRIYFFLLLSIKAILVMLPFTNRSPQFGTECRINFKLARSFINRALLSDVGQVWNLKLVRRQLGTGMFSTCRLAYGEAGSFLWSQNTFVFDNDGEGAELYQFLSTIGKRPRSLLRKLRVLAPFDTCMLMARGMDIAMRRSRGPRSDNRAVLNLRQPSISVGFLGAFALILQDCALEELSFLVPKRTRFWPDASADGRMLIKIEVLPAKSTVVEVQSGALFEGAHLVYKVTDMGITVLTLQGSTISSRRMDNLGLLIGSETKAHEDRSWFPPQHVIRRKVGNCDLRRKFLEDGNKLSTLVTETWSDTSSLSSSLYERDPDSEEDESMTDVTDLAGIVDGVHIVDASADEFVESRSEPETDGVTEDDIITTRHCGQRWNPGYLDSEDFDTWQVDSASLKSMDSREYPPSDATASKSFEFSDRNDESYSGRGGASYLERRTNSMPTNVLGKTGVLKRFVSSMNRINSRRSSRGSMFSTRTA